MNVGDDRTNAPALAKDATAAALTLVRSELALAREELQNSAAELKTMGLLGGAALACFAIGGELLLGSLIAAGRRHPFLLAGLGIALVGAGASVTRELVAGAPKLMPRTRKRIAEDVATIEEGLS